MKRRNFLRDSLLFIFAFIFGYTIKREGENTILQRGNSEMITKEVKLLTEHLADIVTNVASFGGIGDGITDDTQAIKDAIAYTKNTGGIVHLPFKKVKVSSSIVIPSGITVQGLGHETWETNSPKGTTIISSCPENVPTFILGDVNDIAKRGVKLKDIKIIGNSLCNGVKTEPGAYNLELSNVVVQNCKKGFLFINTWNLTAIALIAQTCTDGFYFNNKGGTSSTFMNCLAYSCKIGFKFPVTSIGWTYSSFISCGTDACATSVILEADMRGTTFYNFGVEGATTVGIKINNANGNYVFQNPTLGDHNGKVINLFQIDACKSVSIYDMRMPSAFAPASGGKTLSIASGQEAKVHLYSCYLDGTTAGDASKCQNFGGLLGTKVPKVNSLSGKTGIVKMNGGLSEALFTIQRNETYIVTCNITSPGSQHVQAIVSMSGGTTPNVIISSLASLATSLVDGNGVIKIKNDSSTANFSYNWSATRLR